MQKAERRWTCVEEDFRALEDLREGLWDSSDGPGLGLRCCWPALGGFAGRGPGTAGAHLHPSQRLSGVPGVGSQKSVLPELAGPGVPGSPRLPPRCLRVCGRHRPRMSVREHLRSELFNKRTGEEVSGQEEKFSRDEEPAWPQEGRVRGGPSLLSDGGDARGRFLPLTGLNCLNLFLFSLPPSFCLQPLCLNNRSHLSRDVRGPSAPRPLWDCRLRASAFLSSSPPSLCSLRPPAV